MPLRCPPLGSGPFIVGIGKYSGEMVQGQVQLLLRLVSVRFGFRFVIEPKNESYAPRNLPLTLPRGDNFNRDDTTKQWCLVVITRRDVERSRLLLVRVVGISDTAIDA